MARGIGSPERDVGTTGVRRPERTSLRAAGGVPAQTGPGQARQGPGGGTAQRRPQVNQIKNSIQAAL